MEAMAQVLTGHGYDLQCDGVYDPETDLPPWTSHRDDLFGGATASARDDAPAVLLGRGPYGLRRHAVPLVVFSPIFGWTDPDMPIEYLVPDFDPTSEHHARTEARYAASPGGCPEDSGSQAVTAELRRRGGFMVIAMGPLNHTPALPWLAEQQGLLIDRDGDGDSDDLPLLTWYVKEEFEAGDFSRVREELTRVVEQLVYSRTYDHAQILVDDRGAGLVQGHTPARIPLGSDDSVGSRITVELDLFGSVSPEETDQVFPVTLTAAAGGVTAIGETEVLLVVPGTGRN